MVPFSLAGVTICIDAYEASRGDGGIPTSVPGALPWVSVVPEAAAAACASVGKRLCTEPEWETACRGSSAFTYPYGNTYSGMACNGLDRGLGALGPTGSFTGCQGGLTGLWDMSGNAYEFAGASCTTANCRLRGGSFRSGVGAGFLRCTTGFDFTTPGGGDAVVGFRCCRNQGP
jgi:formylglycine-generating enzyme required for sulfatase activity